MSLDGFRDLMTGVVRVSKRADAVVLDWLFEMPEWTRASPLQTIVTYKTDSGARIAVHPAPDR